MLFDLYVDAPGWLQRLDPRSKLALVAVGTVLFVSAPGPLWLLLLVLLLHLGLATSRVPGRRLRWLLAQLRPLLLVILLLAPWIAGVPGRALMRVGPLVLTDGSVAYALSTALRVWGMSLLVMALLFTTRQNSLVRGLVALGLPYRWGLTLVLALRFIPTFTEQIASIQQAQQARGWDIERGALLKRLRGLAPLFVALTIHVFRSVDTLTMAMTARGVGRESPRTDRRPLRMATADRITLGLAVALLLVWLLLPRFFFP